MESADFLRAVGKAASRVSLGAAVELKEIRAPGALAAAIKAEKDGLIYCINRDGKDQPKRFWLTDKGIRVYEALPLAGRAS